MAFDQSISWFQQKVRFFLIHEQKKKILKGIIKFPLCYLHCAQFLNFSVTVCEIDFEIFSILGEVLSILCLSVSLFMLDSETKYSFFLF